MKDRNRSDRETLNNHPNLIHKIRTTKILNFNTSPRYQIFIIDKFYLEKQIDSLKADVRDQIGLKLRKWIGNS